jgi:hypothetical protein
VFIAADGSSPPDSCLSDRMPTTVNAGQKLPQTGGCSIAHPARPLSRSKQHVLALQAMEKSPRITSG